MKIDLNLEKIKQIDLQNLGNLVVEQEFRHYFLDQPGKEHYKLLAYLSNQFKNTTILDIGTYKGCSALALSYNASNKILSFDLGNYRNLGVGIPNNIEFILDNILKEQYKSIVLEAKLISLDTNHNGDFELEFHKYLRSIKWKGILYLDDIKLNQSMIDYWNFIDEEKYDVTEVGHHSGSGMVYFN
jgi:hypothetical protein